MLYRGDPGETFCLALAEAQAMGVPAVVQPLGSVAERVRRRRDRPGRRQRRRVRRRRRSRVLRDDDLWRRWHRAALAPQRGLELGRGRRPVRGADAHDPAACCRRWPARGMAAPRSFSSGSPRRCSAPASRSGVLIRRNPAGRTRLRAAGVAVGETRLRRHLRSGDPPRVPPRDRRLAPDIVLTWMSRATRLLPARRLCACRPARRLLRSEILPPLRSPGRQHPRHCRLRGRRSGWPRERVHYLPNFVPDARVAGGSARQRRAGRLSGPAAGAGARPASSEQGVRPAARGARRILRDVICGSPATARCAPRLERLGDRGSASPTGCAFSAGARTWPRLLARADLLVCPSLHEPLGNVVIEAWSAGLPVVATASDGPAALIQDGESGILVPLPDGSRRRAAGRSPMRSSGFAPIRALRARLAEAGRRAYEARVHRGRSSSPLPQILRPGDRADVRHCRADDP